MNLICSPPAESTGSIPLRCVKAVGRFPGRVVRFIFSRQMVWLLAILVSLLALLHQYENWHSARELAAVRQAILARVGTENLMEILPEDVPEAENFFAIPVIKSWREPNATSAGGFKLVFPADRLLPEAFQAPAVVVEPGSQHLDLDGWVKQRTSSGKTIPAGQTPASVLKDTLGDGGGMLSQLISGLNRAKSQVIPSRRWNLMEAGGNPPEARLPFITGALQLHNNLAIHLMAAALASDAPGVRNLAGVMLKLGAGFANDPNMVPGLTGAALNQITLKALNPALKCSMLDDSDFSQIQAWLGEVDDVWATERMSFDTLLASYTMFDRFKTQVVEHKSIGANFDWRYFLGTLIAPIGWIDANRAFAAEMMLQQSGTGGGETWRSADAANKQVFAILSKKMGKFNPRTLLAQIAVPGIGGMWTNSAENLFRRRCAILTCGLHRHRLLHGSFPTTLVELDSSLLPGLQTDPAKSDAPLNYRLTDSGFLLWSVGLNRADDGGDAGADWIWRHEPGA